MRENVVPFSRRRDDGFESLEDLDLGHVGRRIRAFYEFVPPPESGFPEGDPEDDELTLVFTPRSGQWFDLASRRILLDTLKSEFASISELAWRGRKYKVLRTVDVQIIKSSCRAKHLGKLFIRLVVEEIV